MRQKVQTQIENKKSKLTNQAGMTLIEIMIVLAIVSGLLAVLGTQVFDRFQKSRVSQAKIQLNEIQNALDLYNSDCGQYPTTEQGLEALRKNPGEDVCQNWGPEPYLKKDQRDPWGTPFVYESDGGSVLLKSLGKNKREGGDKYDEDITLGGDES